MNAYGDRKCLFGTLTLDDLGVTQRQGQKCQISLLRLLQSLRNILMAI